MGIGRKGLEEVEAARWGARLRGLRGATRAWVRQWIVECGTAPCRRFYLSHPLLVRMPGIFLNAQWYCSSGCFADALRERLRHEEAADSAGGRRRPRMPYRLILLSRGLITEEQIAQGQALREQAAQRGELIDLGEALVHLRHLGEAELAAARASEAGSTLYTDRMECVESQFLFPAQIARRFKAVPVHYAAATGRLSVGFTQRIEPRLVQAAQQLTGCRSVEPCFITPDQFEEQLARLDAEDRQRGEQAPPLQLPLESSLLVEALVREATRAGADELRIARVRNLVWARLFRGNAAVDQLIDVEGRESARWIDVRTRPGASAETPRRRGIKPSVSSFDPFEARKTLVH